MLIVTYILITLVILSISLLGYFNITYFYAYAIVQSLNGFLQAGAWPISIAIITNWFGKRGRGTIYGLWASCCNLGNIIGALLTSFFTSTCNIDWFWAYASIGSFCTLSAILYTLLLEPHPENQNLIIQEIDQQMKQQELNLIQNQVNYSINQQCSIQELDEQNKKSFKDSRGIKLMDALKIKDVVIFSMSFFFLKFSVYGMLFWLPTYLEEGVEYSDMKTAIVTVFYDTGGILGNVILGYLSDLAYSRRTPVSVLSTFIAVGVLLVIIYVNVQQFIVLFIFLICVLGFLIEGIEGLIAASICADLGKLRQLQENEKAIATVAGIIDGTGSAGAAIGQVLIGLLQQNQGWNYVFLLMTLVIALSALPLFKKCYQEINEIRAIRKNLKQNTIQNHF